MIKIPPIFNNSNIVRLIKQGDLKSNHPVKILLQSGSELTVNYEHNDGIMSAAKRLKMGMPLSIHPNDSVIKTITRANGTQIKIHHELKNDTLCLRSISERYKEGVITKDYADRKQAGGQVWVNGGDIILKYKGHLSHPTAIEDYTDSYAEAYFKDIVQYIKGE